MPLSKRQDRQLMKSNGLTTYYGYEMSLDQKRDLTKTAFAMLRRLRRSGVAMFQRDDSPEGYDTIAQLKSIAGHIGLLDIETNHRFMLIDEDCHPEFEVHQKS